MEQRKTFAIPYIGIDNDNDNDNDNKRKKQDNIFTRKCCAIYSCVIGAIIVCSFFFVDKNPYYLIHIQTHIEKTSHCL